MSKRIYLVEDGEEGKRPWLVKATTKSIAIRHVAQKKYTAKVATQDQLVELTKEGASVEEAGREAVEA